MNTWHRQRLVASRLSQTKTADGRFWQSLTKSVTIKVTPGFAEMVEMYAQRHDMSVGEIYRRGALTFMLTASPEAIKLAEDAMIAGLSGEVLSNGDTDSLESPRNGHKALGGSSDWQATNGR